MGALNKGSEHTPKRETSIFIIFNTFAKIQNNFQVIVRRLTAQNAFKIESITVEKVLCSHCVCVCVCVCRFMTEAARREQENQKKKVQPKLALSATGNVSRNMSTPPRHSNGSLTPPVTPPITPSSSFRSSTPTGSECDEEEVEYEDSDSDESWTTESAISSESILSSMCMNGGDEKPFACPVPGCKKRYKNVNGIKYHAKNGHRTQIRVRKPFKCRCGKSYKTSQGLRHHTINFHPPL
ncbi:juxtaposed with another zinc finger protein 1a isoform X1 [Ictalurus furcatus]|uniref:juxtaposed with another zinc finger protein 1a isoform X1 n=1 Tax=Ictalurus furcatus TaxID=66913 RepID=UPI002350C05E|nr:juxtaposed with another zinc finger protein 1a isoform X1 [Ictalurus furcatus]